MSSKMNCGRCMRQRIKNICTRHYTWCNENPKRASLLSASFYPWIRPWGFLFIFYLIYMEMRLFQLLILHFLIQNGFLSGCVQFRWNYCLVVCFGVLHNESVLISNLFRKLNEPLEVKNYRKIMTYNFFSLNFIHVI